MVLFYEIKVNCKDKTNENQVLYGGTPSTSAGATSQLTCREGHIWETGEARDLPKPAQCRSVNGVGTWSSDIACLGYMDFILFHLDLNVSLKFLEIFRIPCIYFKISIENLLLILRVKQSTF